MAYHAEETRRRILGAATDEFSARGLAGARVDRIAAAAGCSKERIYANFGDKESLFTTVLNRSFSELGAAVARTSAPGSGVDSVADFAVAVFDHFVDNPANQRLLSWARLEDTHDWQASFAVLASVREASTAELLRLSTGTTRWSLDDVFVLVLSIATAWSLLPRVDGAAGVVPDVDEQREIVHGAVARLLV
ncbi:TetR/AcrR family transcriptional regulator [Curtobacterium sp. VKM Ac-1376]|uniref:TetR/AcrR family transcriptional regulator n=1 Tax=Curtobacterium sp. VKM Ac-1376 TaxID=123312 RepID=UPI00188B28A5|nr:TetR family transcriptional regulator [Curtobacterium sp. VKM Ac-1376]MBF4614030.1 TetR family transcriptional regulator [Curtobacterium sp. VKM Ac-1376]